MLYLFWKAWIKSAKIAKKKLNYHVVEELHRGDFEVCGINSLSKCNSDRW